LCKADCNSSSVNIFALTCIISICLYVIGSWRTSSPQQINLLKLSPNSPWQYLVYYIYKKKIFLIQLDLDDCGRSDAALSNPITNSYSPSGWWLYLNLNFCKHIVTAPTTAVTIATITPVSNILIYI
jgi:hypothetical protein